MKLKQKPIKIIIFSSVSLFFILAIIQVVYNIDKPPIKIWDEGSGAHNAIEMLDSASYFIVYHDGVPEHKDAKPPLALWTKVISYKIFGINEFSVRFPTIIAAILTMLLFIFFFWKYLKNPWMALIAIIIIGITPGYMYYHVARTGDPDTLLLFFVSSYILIFIILIEEYTKGRVKYLFFLGLAIIFAVYTKSIAGLAPLIGLLIYTPTQKNGRKLLLDYRFHLTWFVTIIVILSYYLIREKYDPGYLAGVYQWELGLFVDYPREPKHPEFTFYIKYLKEHGLYQLIYLIPFSIIPLIFSKNNKNRRIILFSLIGFFAYLLGSSASITKNEWYIAPIYAFFWLNVSISLYEIYKLSIFQLHRKKIIFITINILLIVSIGFIYYNKYEKIFDKNQSYKDFTYYPEREGWFLKHVKENRQELKDIIILSTQHQRQMKFYIKKYRYEDSTEVKILKQINQPIINKYILTCQNEFKDLIESQYEYDLIDSAKYGKLYLIRKEK
ncbi:MAG: glycosyltransferase family 39 protein [Bacteroidales bacterium]|nr:glycosyltransferase family 39 protein [Bacteroidales bacterium]